jgi:hypothetical protein
MRHLKWATAEEVYKSATTISIVFGVSIAIVLALGFFFGVRL